MSDDKKSLYLKTDMALDGSGYLLTLEVNDDTARVLRPDDALVYASSLLKAVAVATHDAAVLRQLVEMLEIPSKEAVHMITVLRADRPESDPADTYPLIFSPQVSKGFTPFIEVRLGEQVMGLWTMDDARGHAEGVLTGSHTADLDSAYYRVLIGSVRTNKSRARQAVADLYSLRDPECSHFL